MTCLVSIAARVVSIDTTTVLADLEDEANGLTLLGNLPDPEWDKVTGRATAFYMHGSAPTGLPRIVDGRVPLRVEVKGSTWAQAMTRRGALWTAVNAEPVFYLELVVEGVTTRYVAELASWIPDEVGAADIKAGRTGVTLVFLVQPFPEVTIA